MANEKRLIDANALLDEIQRVRNKYKKVTTFTTHNVIACIKIAPTVDAVEVVHGRWIDEYPYVRCSECNAEWLNCRTDNEPKLFYYCPKCGAKMDGDGNGIQ